MTGETRTRRRGRTLSLVAWTAFALACAINLYGLYAPSQPGPVLFPGVDKVFHLGSFALLMATGMLAGIRARRLAVVLALHAISSEVVQHLLLPGRSGDPVDAVADLLGVAAGWAAVSAVTRRRPRDERA
jgi:VanZ family protein